MLTVTLNQILAANPCYDPIARYGLEKLALDEPISFREIVERAGARDAIWVFAAALPGHEALKRHFAVDCAERVRHLMEDPRSLAALKVARRHAQGQATDEELAAAQADAWAAAWATGAGWDAARVADAAALAAEAAAAAEAAWAAWAAARAAALAAGDAADAAALGARAAADAARVAAAAEAAEAATAAGDAETRWQVQRLIEITEAGAWTNE